MDGRPVAIDPSPTVVVQSDRSVQEPGPVQANADHQAKGSLGSLLDEILSRFASEPGAPPTESRLERFQREPSLARALCLWLGLHDSRPLTLDRNAISGKLSRDIAAIDDLIAGQLNAIIHHPTFQSLEASWRGLSYLVQKLPDNNSVKIRVLNLPWAELVQDQARALEFDQSQLFRKVYDAEFGHPGGEPFGVLLGDYAIHLRPSADHPYDDLETLTKISGVAAAAFAPFLCGVHPSFFGLDNFSELERPLNLTRVFEQVDYLKWRAFRQTEDSRFVGLLLPHVLMRLPHQPGSPQRGKLQFREHVEGPDRSKYLWGSAVYGFGGVTIRAHTSSGWLADIRGVRYTIGERGTRVCLDDGGLVTGLPVHSFDTDRHGLAIKSSTDVVVADNREKELDELGFIPLCHCQDTEFSAFYTAASVQKPTKYDDPTATANARISAMLQYIFCVSRFAHYLKVIGRDKIGSQHSPEDCERFLGDWLRKYTTASDTAGPEDRAKYPLREAKVTIRERADSPGSYNCVIHLRPHFQLD
ncbi:MAG TPA: type VI secretion system contractile sheath large subunit, partial [Isosphaeraceae bacterium]|nr:type VI secretion system contractile sheath large subunit [Isosphaeraceae bacterium]